MNSRNENNLGNQKQTSMGPIIIFIIGVLAVIVSIVPLLVAIGVLISIAVFIMGIIYNHRMSKGLIEKKLRWAAISSIVLGVIPIVIYSIIAVSSYMSLSSSAKEQATESEMSNIAIALELYSADDPNNHYPLTKDYPEVLESGGYMSNIPENDPWDKLYVYQCDDGSSYILSSGGANKRLGDEDDVVVVDGVVMFQ